MHIPIHIGFSVGLGICSPCRSPGAHYYPAVVKCFDGVWICDSCGDPATVAERYRRERDLLRSN